MIRAPMQTINCMQRSYIQATAAHARLVTCFD